ncbi:YigZ family protein [Candidatus Colwellia aromaticivorans]|uniref:YigZ family protein n=1 Tax=Candidatus Colwellia aromaticivorans TaxID=2267621 RepID=UPI000DF3C210|nr:YigZ family protein [Candidatus Colwellia aromaticivorans]
MSKDYQIAVNKVEHETVVNRSRFICYLSPCISIEEAKVQVKFLQQLHPQASHHCYAFLTKAANDSLGYGYSDDGEPSGTAGKPMLAVLQGGDIGEVCAVTVRYFGGTKLGTGGLQRAYADSVRQALVFLQAKTKIAMATKTLTCQYSQVDDVLHIISQAEGQVIEQEYLQQVQFSLLIPEAKLALVAQKLQTLSAGKLVLTNLK